jgi:hypothetical protein
MDKNDGWGSLTRAIEMKPVAPDIDQAPGRARMPRGRALLRAATRQREKHPKKHNAQQRELRWVGW